MQKIVQKHDFYRSNSVRSPKIEGFAANSRQIFSVKTNKSDRLLGACRTCRF